MVPSPPAFAAARAPAHAFAYLPPGAAALADLGPRACRWPLGEPAECGFRFCGAPRFPGSSYCPAHARAARAGAGRARAAKDPR